MWSKLPFFKSKVQIRHLWDTALYHYQPLLHCSFSDKDESQAKRYTPNSSQVTKVLKQCRLQRHLPVIMYHH